MKVRVYRFRFRNRATNSVELSEDYATERAIEQMGGEPVYALMMEAELADITYAGLLRRHKPDRATGS